MKFVSTFFLTIVVVPVFGFATTIVCSNESGVLKTNLIFSFEKSQLEITGSYNRLPLKPYVFLSETAACGMFISSASDCTKSELKNALKPNEYDFQFNCIDGRRGELHFENGTSMAYCYDSEGSLINQKGSDSAQLISTLNKQIPRRKL